MLKSYLIDIRITYCYAIYLFQQSPGTRITSSIFSFPSISFITVLSSSTVRLVISIRCHFYIEQDLLFKMDKIKQFSVSGQDSRSAFDVSKYSTHSNIIVHYWIFRSEKSFYAWPENFLNFWYHFIHFKC